MLRHRLRTVPLPALALGLALGTAAGVGGFTFVYARGYSYLLDDPAAYAAMARQRSPFGDGKASLRIAEAVVRGVPALAGT